MGSWIVLANYCIALQQLQDCVAGGLVAASNLLLPLPWQESTSA
jgi:hypothetical protein